MFTYIVPALNEDDNIAATVEAIASAARECGIFPIQTIVVNDGSVDRTGSVLEQLKPSHPELEVITHTHNAGTGSCMRSALPMVRYKRCTVVPGDNDMPRNFLILQLKLRDAAELVMSFPINSENRSRFRNTLSYLYRIAYMVAFNIHPNYINGPCIYTTERLRQLHLRATRFSITAEVATKFLRGGATYCEIPCYFQTGSRPRHILSVKNILEVIRIFLLTVIDVHVLDREKFGKTPRRIFVEFQPQTATSQLEQSNELAGPE
jgi:glycosyltransferase involved in cell wall biosynthesis